MLSKTRPPEPALRNKERLGTGKPLVAASAVMFIACGFFAWNHFTQNKQTAVRNIVPARRDSVDISVVATGVMRPYKEVKISPKQTGLLKALLVEQGDFVRKGQIIALMDDSNLLGQLESAKGAYLASLDNQNKLESGNRPQEIAVARFQEQRAEKAVRQAERNISRLDAQIEALSATVKRDQAFASRQAMLAQEGAVSDQSRLDATTQWQVSKSQLDALVREREQAWIAVEQSREELNAVRQQHNLMESGFRKEEISAARHNALQAKGQLMHMQSLLEDTRIKAPFDGVITQKYPISEQLSHPQLLPLQPRQHQARL